MRILSIASAGALVLALATAGSSALTNSKVSAADRFFNFSYDNVLGTSLDLKVAAPSAAQAQKAEAAVLHEIDREAKILSSWDADSEFSRWSRTHNRAVPVSSELFDVLAMYDQWRVRTGGALDASA